MGSCHSIQCTCWVRDRGCVHSRAFWTILEASFSACLGGQQSFPNQSLGYWDGTHLKEGLDARGVLRRLFICDAVVSIMMTMTSS